MWIPTVLFAQEPPKRTEPFLRREEDWVVVGLLVAVMYAGAVAFWLVDRWRKRQAAARNSAEELSDFRGMYDRGEITAAEYARLRDRVAKRLKDPKPGGDPADPPPSPPGPGRPTEPPPPA
jgi:hypothetical protein